MICFVCVVFKFSTEKVSLQCSIRESGMVTDGPGLVPSRVLAGTNRAVCSVSIFNAFGEVPLAPSTEGMGAN